MKAEGLQFFDAAVEAHRYLWHLAIFIFIIGSAYLSYLVKQKNKFTFKNTLLAMVGLKKIKRTRTINMIQFLTMITPLLLMAYVLTSYKNT